MIKLIAINMLNYFIYTNASMGIMRFCQGYVRIYVILYMHYMHYLIFIVVNLCLFDSKSPVDRHVFVNGCSMFRQWCFLVGFFLAESWKNCVKTQHTSLSLFFNPATQSQSRKGGRNITDCTTEEVNRYPCLYQMTSHYCYEK